MTIGKWLPVSAARLVLSLAVAGTAVAQGPDSAKLPTGMLASDSQPKAVLVAQVVDTAMVGIPDAEVLVLASDSSVVRTGRTDDQGDIRFRDLPAGGPYSIIARHVAYRRARAKGVHLQTGDTLYYRFELPPFVRATDK